MHTLIYNGVNFSELGPEFEMLGQSSVLEPPEAPQYRRTTLRCRYNFFETSWEDNYGLILQIRDALKTQQGTLQWLDDDNNAVVNRRVNVGPHNLPDVTSQGTYRQNVEFSFFYLEFPQSDGFVPATLPATFTPQGAGARVTLSVVEHWTEGMDTKTYSEWRPDRRRVAGVVSASGKILGNPTTTLAASQTSIFAQKDQLMAQFQAADTGTFVFGTFNRLIRGVKFDAIVDQAQDLIRWTLHGEFTYLPSEQNYAQADLGIEMRQQLAVGTQGTTEIIFQGKIESDSSTHAYALLATLQLAMVPPNYTLIETGNTERIVAGVDSEAGTFIDLTIREIYRENMAGLATWTPDTGGGAMQTLGIVEHFSNAYEGALFSEFRNQRQRAGGVVQMSGRYQLGPDDPISELYTTQQTWLALMTASSSGVLAYGGNFSQDVRLISFVPQVMEGINAITWTLVAHFTRFPNETSYAVCDYTVKTSQIDTEGAVEIALTGKIESQTQASALVALTGIRTAALPTPPTGQAYVRLQADQDSINVSADTDGAAFIRLTFAEKYRLTTGQLVTWSAKQVDSTDVKTGMIRSIYSGQVSAVGATQAQAFSAGVTQANLLGYGAGGAAGPYYPMLLKNDINQIAHLNLSNGQVFVTVEYNFEYLRKGTAIYLEATGDVTKDAFGQDVEVVSGYAAGPTNAVCLAAYQANVRNIAARAGLLVLSEKTGYSKMEITSNSPVTSLDVRFTFVLTLHRTKAATETAMKFSIDVKQNFIELTQTTVIAGVVYAGSAVLAQAQLTAFLATNAPAGTVQPDATTRTSSQAGQNPAGGAQTDFFMTEFSRTYLAVLTGTATVLESDVTVDVTYAGNRWVEQPIPGASSIMQNTGTKPGQRRVAGKVKAATLAAAQTWANAQHAFISGDPSGTFELPQQQATTYEFLPLTVGVPVASQGTVNVRVYVVTFAYAELLPTLTYPG